MIETKASPLALGQTLMVTAALTLVALPLVKAGPVTQDRVTLFLVYSAIAAIVVLLFWSLRWPKPVTNMGRREVALGCIVAAGVVFRLRALFASRSLWFDEVSLATSIKDRSLFDLLTTPLAYHQSAPPGFLTASWLTSELFGTGLIWVRAVPFMAGILTLGLGLMVAKSALSRFPAQAFFMAILSLSPVLIFYSSEMKQYSTDALALTAGLYVAHLTQRRKPTIWPSVIGFVAVISSSAGLIVFFILALMVLAAGFPSNQMRGVLQAGLKHIVALSAWLFAALIHVLYTVVAGVDRAFMQTYWGARGGFAPQSIASLETIDWSARRLIELLWLSFEATVMVGPEIRSVSLLFLPAALVLIVAGCRGVSRQHWPLVLVLLTCISAVVLAQLRLYPLSSRLALYLIPGLAFVMASGVELLQQSDRRLLRQVMNPVATLVLIATLLPTVLGQFSSPYVGKDMDSALKLIVREGQSTDTIVAVALDMRIIDWHREGANFTAPVIALESLTPTQAAQSVAFGAQTPPRMWIVSSARRKEARMLLQEIAPFYSSTAVYSNDDTFIALLSNIGSVSFELTGDRSLFTVTQNQPIAD